MTARQLIWHSCPSLNTVELIVIHSSKLQLSIRFTPSHCLDVRQDWYPMYYPEEMKARVSPMQSIKPHRILAPTRDLNRKPLGPQVPRRVTSTDEWPDDFRKVGIVTLSLLSRVTEGWIFYVSGLAIMSVSISMTVLHLTGCHRRTGTASVYILKHIFQ